MRLTLIAFAVAAITTCIACTPEADRLDAEARRLCAMDGGLKVYETAALPPDKFNKYGQPQVPRQADNVGFGYFYRSTQEHLAGQISQQAGDGAGLKRFTSQIVRTQDLKVMGELRYYGRHGGTVLDGVLQGGGFQCPPVKPEELQKQVFLRANK